MAHGIYCTDVIHALEMFVLNCEKMKKALDFSDQMKKRSDEKKLIPETGMFF